jgi:hypothetical protein
LHRTIDTTSTGTLIRALLLGRDGGLRLFSARSIDARELLMVLEPGRPTPAGVLRDVVDWTPTLRVAGFRPFEILDRLSQSLDAVEQQIEEAAARVRVQKDALMRGDIAALLPVASRQSVSTERVAPDATDNGSAVQDSDDAARDVIGDSVELPATVVAVPTPVLQTSTVSEPESEPAFHDPFVSLDSAEFPAFDALLPVSVVAADVSNVFSSEPDTTEAVTDSVATATSDEASPPSHADPQPTAHAQESARAKGRALFAMFPPMRTKSSRE